MGRVFNTGRVFNFVLFLFVCFYDCLSNIVDRSIFEKSFQVITIFEKTAMSI